MESACFRTLAYGYWNSQLENGGEIVFELRVLKRKAFSY